MFQKDGDVISHLVSLYHFQTKYFKILKLIDFSYTCFPVCKYITSNLQCL